MAIKDDLKAKISEIAVTTWGTIPDGYTVPDETDLTYGNSGVNLDATILYADIHKSTEMVDTLTHRRSAEYYKAFLRCASDLIRRNNGTIQAYDGDRVMAVYLGINQADDAVRTALELHCAVNEIVNPKFASVYSQTHRILQFTVGIDSGPCLAIKVGVRDHGELAWIGAPANYAAKLNSFEGLDIEYPTRITVRTFNKLLAHASKFGATGEPMWDGSYNNLGESNRHYRTKWFRDLP
jgi:class 3 adenylate cyclase